LIDTAVRVALPERVHVRGSTPRPRQSNSAYFFSLSEQSPDGRTYQIQCCIWKRLLAAIPGGFDVIQHADEAELEVWGSLSWWSNGTLMLVVDDLRFAGDKGYERQLRLLRERLEREGLFHPERKRPLPAFPQRVAVITSPHGQAIQDVIGTIARRFPVAEVLLLEVSVQGETAVSDIVTALQTVNRLDAADVIVLARGGGGELDFAPFNTEEVARAIFASHIPVVTGIGHTGDHTIADDVADAKGNTPTHAAELAVPDGAQVLARLDGLEQRLGQAMATALRYQRATIEAVERVLARHAPDITGSRQRLEHLATRLEAAAARELAGRQRHLDALARVLESLSYTRVLARGFAALRHPDGTFVRRPETLAPGTTVLVETARARLATRIESVGGLPDSPSADRQAADAPMACPRHDRHAKEQPVRHLRAASARSREEHRT
jgi:exodeoxyribonuclease VII large subunit